jgi:hypothetical protein
MDSAFLPITNVSSPLPNHLQIIIKKKQATYVSKNRISPLSSNVTYETADQDHLNSSMDLDLDNDPNIIETKPPPPIFIHTVNDFAFFCAQIKEITKNDKFSCKSSINGV